MSEEVPTTPLFEDNNRKGRTRGEAIFGDKQANLVNDTVPEAAEVIDLYNATKDAREAATHAAALLAINEAAAQGDWSQEKLEAAQAELKRQQKTSVQ